MTARPHCRHPEACVAKGDSHCRGCTGAVMMQRLLADPERVAVRLRKSIAARDTPEHRQHLRERIKRQRRDPQFRRASRDAGKRTLMAVNADPAVRARTAETQRARYAKRQADRVGIPVVLIDDFRALRHRRFPAGEARGILRASHPDIFATFNAERRAAAARSCGPLPAIGTEERATWSRRIAALVTAGASAPIGSGSVSS